jgi:hypothetical protein
MVLYNNGAGRRDAVCNTMLTPQRVFASGNERTTVRTNGKYKFGIEYGPSDSMGMLYDLMNESKTRQTYYIEMVSVEIIHCAQCKVLTMTDLRMDSNWNTWLPSCQNGLARYHKLRR